MTLTKLVLIVGVLALILTLVNIFVLNKNRNTLISYLQNFCGVLFIVSGLVKAVDPLGTAYKMVDYFAEFETVFADTWFSFIAGIFPVLSNASVGFSVFMIVLEIVLGVMLIIGFKNKFSAWLFFGIVVFFAFLTGFTYLTGYVPEDVGFFQFSKWGPYVKSNMKVTDCGCFGDFIKLEPKTSFFKDIFLLIPAVLFLMFNGKMFQLFENKLGYTVSSIALILSLFFCFSNYVWDIPSVDFRPFAEGVDIVKQRQLESEAQANAPVTYVLIEKATGEKLKIDGDELMKNFSKYPKSAFEYLDPEYGEPAIPITKISEFMVTNTDGDEVTEELLEYNGPSIMIVNYKLAGTEEVVESIKRDTVFQIDTILTEGADLPVYVKRISDVLLTPVKDYRYTWDKDYQLPFINNVVPFGNAAMKEGIPVYSITKLYPKGKIDDFAQSVQADFPIYTADDIMLKTIIRSNPGVVYLEDSKIVKKWHHKKLPSFDDFKKKYLSK